MKHYPKKPPYFANAKVIVRPYFEWCQSYLGLGFGGKDDDCFVEVGQSLQEKLIIVAVAVRIISKYPVFLFYNNEKAL